MLFKTQAFYFDGKTSVSHNVELVLDTVVKELSFAQSECHSLYDIEYEVYNGKMEIKFKNREMLVVVEDRDFIKLLDTRIGIYQKLINLNFKTHLLLAFLAVLLIVAIYITFTPFIARKAVSLIPVAVDVKLGGLFMEKLKPDSAKTFLLNEFASKLSWNSDVDLNFHVVKSNAVNAFALPSGDVIVFTGLLGKLDDYELLAALLGHEVSHVNKRHSMQIICKSLAGYALISVLTTDVSALTAVILESANMLNNLSYSRDMELEADDGGIALLEDNGISAVAMLGLMRVLQYSAPNFDTEILSSHPIMEKRIKNAESKIKQKEYAKNSELEKLFNDLRQTF